MKGTKRIIAGMLAAVMLAAVTTGCADNTAWEDVTPVWGRIEESSEEEPAAVTTSVLIPAAEEETTPAATRATTAATTKAATKDTTQATTKTTTKSSAEVTTKSPAAEEEVPANTSKLDGDDYIKLDLSKSLSYPGSQDSPFGNKYMYFYNFSQNGIVGSGIDVIIEGDIRHSEDRCENTVNGKYIEMYFGLRAEINGSALSVKSYRNIEGVTVNGIVIKDRFGKLAVQTDKASLTAELADNTFVNGIYSIEGKFTYDKRAYNVFLYLFVNCRTDDSRDHESYICYGARNTGDTPKNYETMLLEKVQSAGITDPYRDAMNTSVRYPNEATNMTGGRFDTDAWKKKSYEILKGYENASASFKATLLHDWMTENLVYDEYKVRVLYESRYYMDYVSGKYYVSRINIGVCRDFSNIYLIMCREQGIPCVMCNPASRKHVWNLVYLDGRWFEVDLTRNIDRYAYSGSVTEDITEKTEENIHSYVCFCNSEYEKRDLDEINTFLHIQY